MKPIGTISKKEINTIVREFKALAKGKCIKVKLPPAILPPLDMHISWESDCTALAQYDDYPSSKQLIATYKLIEQEADKQRKRYDIKINKFIKKVISLEDRYGFARDRLWEDYLWPVC
jgi:hypothetical protein